MSTIQKQSIQSTIMIMLGFAIGAFNMIIFAPKVLTAAELGLTRIITDAGIVLGTLCTFGTLPVIAKFFPNYRRYLKPGQDDLPFLTLSVCLLGFPLMAFFGYLAKDIIIWKFSEKSPLFVQYSYLVYPYALFVLLFIWLEAFSWTLRKSVAANALKETLARVIFTVLLVLIFLDTINLNQFFTLFSFMYVIPAALLFIVLRKTGQFHFNTTISPVTRRLKGKMINFGLFIFGAQFLNLLSRTVDTFLLASKSDKGLVDAAVFTLGTYVVTLMEVPQRSITTASIPVLSEAWKNKDLKRISTIYTKSVSNLLVIGLIMFGVLLLNIQNLAIYLGKDYSGIVWLVLFMGTGKLIDLGTGTNSQIIGTSNYWRVDFTINVIYTILALPMNYFLIARYGLMGAAYASLISISFYNAMRFGFLWYKFGLQPYRVKHLLAVFIAVVVTVIVYFIPDHRNIIIDTLINTFLFLTLVVPLLYFTRISDEINALIRMVFGKLGIGGKGKGER